MQTRALLIATAAGAVLQLAMVLAGHQNVAVANLFAVGGMGISLLAGVLYAVLARPGARGGALGGALAGGACALIGIAVSYGLGDVAAMLLALGTLSSAVTGAIGGAVAGALARRPGAAA
jgi:hypothetical protein